MLIAKWERYGTSEQAVDRRKLKVAAGLMAGSIAVGVAVPQIAGAAMSQGANRPTAERIVPPNPDPPLRSGNAEASRSFIRPPLDRDAVYALKRRIAERQQRLTAAEQARAALAAAEQDGTYWFGRPDDWAGMAADQRSNASLAYHMAAHEAWFSREQVACLDDLWFYESAFKTHAPNPASQADGIPQANPASKMAAAGPDWRDDPATQIRWGLGYIEERYGTPCGAEVHEQQYNFY